MISRTRTIKQATPKLAEIAARIDAHLKRFEADPAINARNGIDGMPYWLPRAKTRGRFVVVVYVYDATWSLTKDQALGYLAWLDAGNVGKHIDMPQEAAR